MAEYLFTITDKDIFETPEPILQTLHIRFAARGIVINDHGQIAILHKVKKNEYKLPGGGLEHLETPLEAFRREVMEETGCLIKNVEEIGVVEEIKTHTKFRQLSTVYVSRVKKDMKFTKYSKQEIDEGSETIWMSPRDAVKVIGESIDRLKASEYDSLYQSKFVVQRDKKIIEYFIEHRISDSQRKYGY